jgi:hypothetical protein
MEASLACGSAVLLFSFAQKNSQREFFCAKDRESFTLLAARCSSGSVTV